MKDTLFRRWLSIITAFVIILFLMGYIIPIKRGTLDGRITGGIGVVIILITAFLITIIRSHFKKNRAPKNKLMFYMSHMKPLMGSCFC